MNTIVIIIFITMAVFIISAYGTTTPIHSKLNIVSYYTMLISSISLMVELITWAIISIV